MDFDWSALKNALGLFKDAIGLAKDAKELLPIGDKKTTITQSLEKAEKAANLAEAQIAKSLGYQLCKCTFPPQIMMSIGYEEYDEKFRCPNCNKIYPPDEPALPKMSSGVI